MAVHHVIPALIDPINQRVCFATPRFNETSFSHYPEAFAQRLGAEYIHTENRAVKTRKLTAIMIFT